MELSVAKALHDPVDLFVKVAIALVHEFLDVLGRRNHSLRNFRSELLPILLLKAESFKHETSEFFKHIFVDNFVTSFASLHGFEAEEGLFCVLVVVLFLCASFPLFVFRAFDL